MTSLRVFLLTVTLISGALSAFDYSECGKQRADLGPEIKIVGGKEAQPGEWPWQAALYRFDRRICGATVIHPYWIATAAHCVDVINDPPIFDYLVGSNSISNYNESQYYQFRETVEVYVHPNYRLESSDYDIALMKMAEPFEWDDDGYVYPACIPSADMDADFSEGTDSVITGWGATREGGPQSDMLNEVVVPVVSQAECNASYEGGISDYMICAGLPEGGKDSCQGDSGGPMVALKDGLWYLIGVVSWGTGCAREGYPGVYARVTSFADWIEPIFNDGVPDGMPVGQCPDEDFQCGGGFCIPKSWRCDGYRDCYYSADESYCESALKAFDVYPDKSISENSNQRMMLKADDSNACAMRCLEETTSPACLAFDVLDELDENNKTQCVLAMGDYITENQTQGVTHFVRSPVNEPGSELTSALGTILTPAYSIDSVTVNPGLVNWTLSIDENEYNHLVFNFISIKSHPDESSCDDINTQNLVVIRPGSGETEGTITQCLSQVQLNVDYQLDDEDAVLELYSHDPTTYGFVVDYRASWFCDSVETMAPGYLVSPRYGIGDYPRNVRCRSKIEAPMGHRVHLEVEFFRIEFNGNIQGFCPSNWDTLVIYDGPDDNADRMGTYCGDLIPSEFWSTSNSLYIVFKSDSSAQETGYKLNYYFAPEMNETMESTTHMPTEPSTTPSPTTMLSEEPSSSSSKPEMTETEKQVQELENSLKAYKVGISAVMILGTVLVGVLIAAIVTISRREAALIKKTGYDEKNDSNSDGSINKAYDADDTRIEEP